MHTTTHVCAHVGVQTCMGVPALLHPKSLVKPRVQLPLLCQVLMGALG